MTVTLWVHTTRSKGLSQRFTLKINFDGWRQGADRDERRKLARRGSDLLHANWSNCNALI